MAAESGGAKAAALFVEPLANGSEVGFLPLLGQLPSSRSERWQLNRKLFWGVSIPKSAWLI